MGKPNRPVRSMTGYASVSAHMGERRVRIDLRSLNHRFLDLKVRLPKELQALDQPLRQRIQKDFRRGSVEFKLEYLPAEAGEDVSPEVQPNLSLAAQYFECLNTIQKTVGLSDPIRTVDIAQFPDVMTVSSTEDARELTPEELWGLLSPAVDEAVSKAIAMRETEGAALVETQRELIRSIGGTTAAVRKRRAECQDEYKKRVDERIRRVFEAYPVADEGVKAVLESRIAQELALILDRTDIEEELTRLEGHIEHFLSVMDEGSPAGRKLDFILQEINREVNTLGNKAQDLPISEDVVQLKVMAEQLREQTMNIE